MRKSVAILLTSCLVLGALRTSRADDQADARGVIAKAMQATGGEEKLAKLKGQSWTEKGTFYGMGAGVPYTGSYSLQWPDKFKMEIQGVFTIVVNGDKGWTNANGSTQEMTKEQLEEQKQGLYNGWVASLVPLKDKAYKLSLLGESKVGDRPAVGVKVARKDHYDVNLYFDKETNLLAKTSSRLKEAMSGQEVEQEATYSDYKDVSGVKIPTKVSIKRDGKQFVEAENSDVKLAEKLDDSVFAKP
jgi:outer membrane lipoprotein-sorting protein